MEITGCAYAAVQDYENSLGGLRDLRVTDTFSKMGLSVCARLWKKAGCALILPESLGVVLATRTGPAASVRTFASNVAEHGFYGVNPGLFPNIMLSTSLARITVAFGIKGVCVPLFIQNGLNEAVECAEVLISGRRCDSVIILSVNCGCGCFGMLIEKAGAAEKRKVRSLHLPLDSGKSCPPTYEKGD